MENGYSKLCSHSIIDIKSNEGGTRLRSIVVFDIDNKYKTSNLESLGITVNYVNYLTADRLRAIGKC